MNLIDLLIVATVCIFFGVLVLAAVPIFSDRRARIDRVSDSARAHAETQVSALLAVIDHLRSSMEEEREMYLTHLQHLTDSHHAFAVDILTRSQGERERLYETVIVARSPRPDVTLTTLEKARHGGDPVDLLVQRDPRHHVHIDLDEDTGQRMVPVGFDQS